jgi:hypothetical protein
LSETGFVEGRNLAIEFRWALNDRDRLPELEQISPGLNRYFPGWFE